MKKLLLCFLVLLACHFSYSQKQDYNWCFGDSCGLHFTDSTIEVFTSALTYDTTLILDLEIAASISDSDGNLLFYTNGPSVWNSNHQLMQHGTGLHSSTTITNGSLILQKPEDTSLYYLFHINDVLPPFGFYYALVNMNLDNGFGDIVTGKKNVLLYNDMPLSEKLAALKHANGRDWWIINHARDSNLFFIYLLTPDTITLNSIQTIGTFTSWITNNFSGEMVFSPNGGKLALVGFPGIINLFAFDRCLGVILNDTDLSDGSNTDYYGCSFSPDESKLYVSSVEHLYQFNLDDSNIIASKTLIWTNPYYVQFGDGYFMAQHQLTPNGKIFITLVHGGSPEDPDTFINQNLCVIDKPNELGVACDFIPCSLYLGGHHSNGGLPNSPNYNLGALEGSPCDTLSIPTLTSKLETPNFHLSPNPASSSFNITYTIHQPATLTITNTYGSIVKQLTLHPYSSAGSGGKNRIVNVDDLAAGIYLVTLHEGNKISSKKIIVER